MFNVFIDDSTGTNVDVISLSDAYAASAVVNAYMDAPTGGFQVCSDLHGQYDEYAMVTPALRVMAERGLITLP